MTFEEPIPFAEAVETLRARQLLPTDLGTAALRQLDAGLREVSLFSARTTKAAPLQKAKDVLEQLLQGTTNVATARMEMQDLYDELGYTPEGGFPGDVGLGIPPAEPGELRDLSSNKRIDLLLETNLRLEANRALQRRGQTDFALYAWPCYELVRIYPRRVPRGEEEPTPSEGWPERWEQCGGSFYDGRMIARKDDDIWSMLGDSSRFDDALDTDVPPFAFNSGYGWREIEREEAIALGVIDASADIQGRTSERTAAREVAADFDPEFLAQVVKDLRVQAAEGRARLERSRTPSPALQGLGPEIPEDEFL